MISLHGFDFLPFVFLNSAAELIIFSSFSCGGFETLGLFSAAAGTSGSFEVDNSPTGTVCPFFSVLFWSGLLLISPSAIRENENPIFDRYIEMFYADRGGKMSEIVKVNEGKVEVGKVDKINKICTGAGVRT